MDSTILISDVERDKLISRLVDELPVLRLKTNMSQDDLANLLDISRQTYSSIESKKRKMTWRLYLSLVLIFYHNKATHDFVIKNDLFPKQLISSAESDVNLAISSFVQMDRDDIRNHLDDQALHAIETIIVMEYARCNNMSGDAVIKAFDGKRLTQVSDQDVRAKKALKRINAEAEEVRQ